VTPDLEHRRVLIVGGGRPAPDAARIFLASMGCECSVAPNIPQALACLEQKQFDAVVLDSQCLGSSAAEAIAAIAEVCGVLAGRLVVLTNENTSSEIKDLVSRYSLPHVQEDRLTQQLWSTLGSLFHPDVVFGRITHIARPVVDNVRQPHDAGRRDSNPLARRLLYTSGSVTVDLMLETQPDSKRVAIAGQVLDSAKPDRRLANVPVVLQSSKGPVKFATTNKFGELQLDLGFEPGVALEIRISDTHWVSVALPDLQRNT
jgi:CheY-like chemotaxis protein